MWPRWEGAPRKARLFYHPSRANPNTFGENAIRRPGQIFAGEIEVRGAAGRGRDTTDGGTTELLETYASAPRRGILDLVSRYPSSVNEIGKAVGLEPVSVRFHLQKLLKLGLVEEVKQQGKLGRPRYLYRATNRRFEVAFPSRNYMQLASILLGTLAAGPDHDKDSTRLRNAGT